MSVNRKKAPRREVLEIERVGEWGAVTYRHRLACGHTDVRKRPAPATHISCVLCQFERDTPRQAPVVATQRMPLLDEDDFVDVLASSDADAARVKAGLAARFGVQADAVDVVVDAVGKLSYVLVFLDAATARRLS